MFKRSVLQRMNALLLIVVLLSACIGQSQPPAPSPLPIPHIHGRSESAVTSPFAEPTETPFPPNPSHVHVPMMAEAAPDLSARSDARPLSIDSGLLLGSLSRIPLRSLRSFTGAPQSIVSGKRLYVPMILSVDHRVIKARADFDCSQDKKIGPEQCDALLVFYALTNGDAWKKKDGWLKHPDPCKWHGVGCPDPDFDKVKTLLLETNNLDGILPPEIAQLPLTFLRLYGNRSKGAIPPSIVQMNDLEEISLSDNQLTGEVPLAILDFDDLRVLHLDRNAGLYFDTSRYTCAHAPPKTRHECEALVAIYREMDGPSWKFSGNDLSPWAWLVGRDHCLWREVTCDSGYVTELRLRNAQITGPVSKSFGWFSQLSRLDLSNNQLSGPIPEQFGYLEKLRFLNLAGNHPTLCMPASVRPLIDISIKSNYHPPPGGYCP